MTNVEFALCLAQISDHRQPEKTLACLPTCASDLHKSISDRQKAIAQA